MYICTGCLEVYKNDFENSLCPKSTCTGEVIEVNSTLMPLVRLLLERGYYVKKDGCNFEYSETEYVPKLLKIVFEDYVQLPSIPEDMQYNNEDNSLVVTFDSDDTIENLQLIASSVVKVLRWIDSLEVAHYEECAYVNEGDYRKCYFCDALDACKDMK